MANGPSATKGFSEQDTLSHEVLRSTLRQRIDNYSFKEYEMPVNQMSGIQQGAAETLSTMPRRSVWDYEDILARLEALPAEMGADE